MLSQAATGEEAGDKVAQRSVLVDLAEGKVTVTDLNQANKVPEKPRRVSPDPRPPPIDSADLSLRRRVMVRAPGPFSPNRFFES